MTKAIRVAVLSTFLALLSAPAFAGPGGSDPPPPPPTGSSVAASTALTAVLSTLGL
jgi:hypothetical protein